MYNTVMNARDPREPHPETARFERLLYDEDFDSLVDELRCREDAEHRRLAAQALGQLEEPAVIPWLLQAVLCEPEPGVQTLVTEILRERLGAEFDAALQVEATDPPDPADWLQDCTLPSWDDEGYMPAVPDGRDFTAEETEQVRGLLMVARGETDPSMRIKAIRALSRLPHMDAVEVLAVLSLEEVEEDAAVRLAARQALEVNFGEEGTEQIIETYRMDEDWDEAEADESYDQPEYLTLERLPALREESNAPWALLGLLGMFVLIIAWLLLRGGG